MATVIKAGQVGPLLQRLSTVDLADHLAEADAVMAASRRRAEQTLLQARRQADRVRSESKATGYDAGYRQGYEEGVQAGRRGAHDEAIERFEQRHAAVVSDMQRAISEIDRIKEALGLAAERDILDFALCLATKLTFAIGRLHRESAVANFKRALRLVESRTNLTVRAAPDDLETLKTFAAATLSQFDESRSVKMVADASLSPGGCIVENDRGRVDATLETQTEEIVSLLLGENRTEGDQAVDSSSTT